MRKVLTLCAFATSLVASMPAHAEFIFTDRKVQGDNQAVLDTVHGKEWLRFANTTQYTYNEVVEQTAQGGQFYGWRLPTEAELRAMLTEFYGGLTIDHGHRQDESGSNKSKTRSFNNVFGTGRSPASSEERAGGIYKRDNPTASSAPLCNYAGCKASSGAEYGYFGSYVTNGGSYTTSFGMRYEGQTELDIIQVQRKGTWLVSDGGTTLSSTLSPELNINNPDAPINKSADVSVHAGFGLLGVLLMAFGIRRRELQSA